LEAGGSLALQLAGFQWSSFAADLRQLGYEDPRLWGTLEKGPVVGRVVWPGASAH
jgi:hypothetical protein